MSQCDTTFDLKITDFSSFIFFSEKHFCFIGMAAHIGLPRKIKTCSNIHGLIQIFEFGHLKKNEQSPCCQTSWLHLSHITKKNVFRVL